LNKQLKTQGDVMNQKDFQTEVMRQFAKINGRLDVIEADIVEIKSDIGVLKKAVIKLNEKVFGVAALEV
ncbi:hypothetical protein, partial [[Acholeplasma] multilocale]|uniref:hypothetical protein n=1 Tax=[Acholeplasma] multilocale TaxID=264638 RepID=UPI00244DE796